MKVASHRMDATGVQRFQREAVTSKLLEHDNIVKVHDFGLIDGIIPYFVMDYVEGESLSSLIAKESRLSKDAAFAIFLKVAEALSHAHHKGVVHRDLKPSNILVLKDGVSLTVKVVDFGIAKLIVPDAETQGLTKTGEIFGSPLYMSPEQCAGGVVDKRSDIYSFGCSLFEAISGMPPFKGETALQTLILHQTAKLPSLKESTMSLIDEPAVDHLLRKLTAKDAEQRYQDFDSIRIDMALIRNGLEPASATLFTGSGAKPAQTGKPQMSKSTGVIALSVIAICLSIFTLTRQSDDSKNREVEVRQNKVISRPYKTPLAINLEKDEKFSSTFVGADGRLYRKYVFPKGKEVGIFYFGHVTVTGARQAIAKGEVIYPASEEVGFQIIKDGARETSLMRGFNGDEFTRLRATKMMELVDDKAIHDFSHLRTLNCLELDTDNVSDYSIPVIDNSFPKLEILSVPNTLITGPGLAKSRLLKQLTLLRMSCNENGRAVVDALVGSKKITYLTMTNCDLKDADLEKIATMPNLTELQIRSNAGITDKGIAKLAPLKRLKSLDLVDCKTSPAWVKSLQKIPNLRLVNIKTESWSAAERATLKNNAGVFYEVNDGLMNYDKNLKKNYSD
ncbi:MAG: protein kinase [Leptolyngbya sp.]|nr:protein kinase [Candidatus Melainabacteria bacterium]